MPGQIENFTIILDTKGIGVTGFASIKWDDIKDFVEEMGSILRG